MSKRKYIILGVLCLVIVFLFGCGIAEFIKADFKLNQKKYEEAIPIYKEYLAKNPNFVHARSRLGFAYLKTGRLDEAITEFKAALKIKPGEPYSVLYLGLAYLNKKEFGKAIKVWQGYRNKERPLVENEIKRQLTLLQIAEGQRAAKKTLAEEKKLKAAKPDANTIAVCYYRDLSPDKSMRAFQKGLAAMVITDLSKVKSLKVVERLRLQALLEEMKLGQTGIVDERTAPRVGWLLGTENLTTGSLTLGIQAATSLTSTSRGGVEGTAMCTMEKEKFFELPCCIVKNVARIMGIDLTPKEIEAICGKPHTKSYEAFIYFGQALDALDAGHWAKAKDLFTKSLKADPRFDLAREGDDSCPGASSPGIGQLGVMSVSQVSTQAETAINTAQASQDSADEEAAEAERGGGDCFAYDTMVVMADKSLKRIIDLHVGDTVQAYDVKTGETVTREVTNKYRADQDHYYLINGALKVTANHPVFTVESKWVKVADLRVGDRIASIDGAIEITSIEKVKYEHRVYNFKVENSHNYFVSAYGKNLYLVHNCK
jgi:tetratricopeptide (TPR) repeat protein